MRKVVFENRHVTLEEHVDRPVPTDGLHRQVDTTGSSRWEHWYAELKLIIATLDGVELIQAGSHPILTPRPDEPERVGMIQGEGYFNLVRIRLVSTGEEFELRTGAKRTGPPELLPHLHTFVEVRIATYPDDNND